VVLWIALLWNVTSFSLAWIYRRSGGTFCLYVSSKWIH